MVSLLKENRREMRENMKHKIRSLDVVDILCDMARASQLSCPKYVSSSLLASSDVAALILNCKKVRW